MNTPVRIGGEFLVNTTTQGDQWAPTITALSDGRFVVAWTDASQTSGDTSESAVRAQVFNANGSRAGDEFLVNTTTQGHQWFPTITALSDGRFVVAWTDVSWTGGDTSGDAIRAQVFNANGSRAGDELLVNTTTRYSQSSPTITALSDGRFVVAWQDGSHTGGDTSGGAIRAQVFSANGSRAGDEFLVNTTTQGNQSEPTITALSDGRFVVAWMDESQTGGDTSWASIRAQVFNANGSRAGDEFLVNTTTHMGQSYPTITALSDGRFVVAWIDASQTGGDTWSYAIRAQVFNTNGSKAGDEFLVNTTTQGHQYNPTITALSDGRFVVAWTDYSGIGGDTSGASIRAQVFNANGSKAGTEFLVNTTTQGNQSEPTITALSDGRFVVAWMDGSETGGDTSSWAIRAQIFDAGGGGSVNAPPVIETMIADLQMAAGSPDAAEVLAALNATLRRAFSDPDGDTLQFSFDGLPPGLSGTAGGRIRGQLPTEPGDYVVTVTVDDLRGGTASQSFNWTVVAAPSPPAWDFSTQGSADVMKFALLAMDSYNGDNYGEPLRFHFSPPEGWSIILTTYDGRGAFPINPVGEEIPVYRTNLAPGMQATAYLENATGRVVIAYRGTDNGGPSNELVETSIALGLGLRDGNTPFSRNSESFLEEVRNFYQAVVTQTATPPESISFAGHSLGGMAAGYMAGITGQQAMIFASGPHTAMFRFLDSLFDRPAGFGYLQTGQTDFSGLVHTRVTGEILGTLVDIATSAVDDLAELLSFMQSKMPIINVIGKKFNPFAGIALTVLQEIASMMRDKWGDAQAYGTQLEELAAGYQNPGSFSAGGLNPLELHGMSLTAFLLYGTHQAKFEHYTEMPELMRSLFASDVAQSAQRETGFNAAAPVFLSALVRSTDGRWQNPLFTLLSDVEDLGIPWLHARPGTWSFGLQLNQGARLGGVNDTGLMQNLSRLLVEAAYRDVGSDSINYELSSFRNEDGWSILDFVSLGGGEWAGLGQIVDLLQTAVGSEASLPQSLRSADRFIFSANPDALSVGKGSSGNDIMIGARRRDDSGVEMDGRGGNDFLVGTMSDDTLIGGGGSDTLVGGVGLDVLYGGNSADTLIGGERGDLLFGGDGRDVLYGGVGNDTLNGDDSSDCLYGGAGRDLFFGGWGRDTLYGGKDRDTIYGDGDNDLLYGDDGDDLLYGGSSDDTLDGGMGDDTLTGGPGADHFVFSVVSDAHGDRITDFSRSQGDKIDLSQIAIELGIARLFFAGTTHERDVGVVSYKVGATNAKIYINADGGRGTEATITLTGQIDLYASDFILG